MFRIKVKSRRLSKRSCCVVGCSNQVSNTTDQIKFYGFPNRPWEQEKREKWIQAVDRINPDGSNWRPKQFTQICSAHFVGNQKSGHPLSPSFYPTIFPNVNKLRNRRKLSQATAGVERQVTIKTELAEGWVPPPIVFVKTEVTDDDVNNVGRRQPVTGLDLLAASSYSASINHDRDGAQSNMAAANRPDFRFVDVSQTVPAPSMSMDVDPLERSGASLPEATIKLECPEYPEECPLVPIPHLTGGLDKQMPTDRGVSSSVLPGGFTFCSVIGKLRHEEEGLKQESVESSVEVTTFAERPIKARGNKGQNTDERPFACDICSARFTIRYNLTRHRRIHAAVKPYPCDVCPARFSAGHYLVQHEKTHSREKPHACHVCGARFTHCSNLASHETTHSGDKKPFTCDVCEAEFAEKAHLVAHFKTHDGAGGKPFACDLCHSRFVSKYNATQHKKTHARTGQKPFACDVCDAKFALNSTLTRHMKTHSVERPYACLVCKARFFRSASLSKHERTHTA